MQKFHFRSGKSTLMALLLGLFGLSSAWFWWNSGGVFSFLFALLCGAGAGKLLMDAASDVPALVFDSGGVQVRRTWGGLVEVSWRQVQQISVEVMTVRYFGFIPIAKQETLVVKCDGGLFGARRLRLSLRMLELPSGGVGHLLGMLQQAHVAAIGEAGVVMAGAGEHGWGVHSVPEVTPVAQDRAGFDADAALARYLARKETQAPLPSENAVGRPVAPSRPAFGRRISAG